MACGRRARNVKDVVGRPVVVVVWADLGNGSRAVMDASRVVGVVGDARVALEERCEVLGKVDGWIWMHWTLSAGVIAAREGAVLERRLRAGNVDVRVEEVWVPVACVASEWRRKCCIRSDVMGHTLRREDAGEGGEGEGERAGELLRWEEYVINPLALSYFLSISGQLSQ